MRCQRNPFYSAVLLYTYISRFSVNPQHQQKRNIRQSCYHKFCLKPLFIPLFNFSRKRPRLLSSAKAGTHSPSPTGSHTRAYTAKHGRFGWGWYLYPRSVSHGSETLRGQGVERQTLPLLGLCRGCSQRTQKAFGTAMRLCASLFRGVAAPLGCVIFSVSVEIAACMPCAQGLSVCARRGVVSLPSARFTCC